MFYLLNFVGDFLLSCFTIITKPKGSSDPTLIINYCLHLQSTPNEWLTDH